MRIDEFILSRIAEDEAAAREVTPGPWEWERPSDGDWALGDQSLISRGAQDEDGDPKTVLYGWGYDASGIDAEDADRAHIARWHPGRVLAECAAKRAIVAAAQNAEWCADNVALNPGYLLGQAHAYRHALRSLAAVYADHPDYQPEWAA